MVRRIGLVVALVLASCVVTPARAEPPACTSRTVAQDCGGATVCCCGDRVTSNYTMPGDLDCIDEPVGQHGIRINAENVVFDGGGYTIYGPTGAFHNENDDHVGIKVESIATNAVVKNVTVIGGDIGPPPTPPVGPTGPTGTWKRCIEVKANGVTIGDDATQVVVESCGRCGRAGSYGIDVAATGVTVKNSVVRYVGDEGIHIGSGANDADILNNTVIMNDLTEPVACGKGLEAIYLLENTGARVAGNQTSQADGWGLHMKDASHATIENNDFVDRGVTLRGDSDYNTLSDNLVDRRITIEDRSEVINSVLTYFFPNDNRVFGGEVDGLAISDHCIVLENALNNRIQSVSVLGSVQAAVHTIATIEAGKGLYQQPATWPVNTLTAIEVDGDPLVINDPNAGGDDVEFEYGTVIVLETPGTPVVDAVAVADGYIWSGASSASVFSSETSTVAKVTGGCNGHERVSLFKFGISATASGAIDATLKLRSPLNMSGGHGGILYGVDPAANAVTETGMSWDWFTTQFGAGAVGAAIRQGTPLVLQPGAAQEVDTSYDVTKMFQLNATLDAVMFSISGDPASQVLARYYSKETSGKEPKLSYTPVTATVKQRDAVPPLDANCIDNGCSDSKEAYVRSVNVTESNGDKVHVTAAANTQNGVVESYLTFNVANIGSSTRQTAKLYVHVRFHDGCLDSNPSTDCFAPNSGAGPKVHILSDWDSNTSTQDDGWQEGTGDADVSEGNPPHPDWIHWNNRPTRGVVAGQMVLATTNPYGGATDGFWWVVELSHALANELPFLGTNGQFTVVLVAADTKLVRFDGMRNNENDGLDRPRLVLGPVGTPTGTWPP